MWYNMNTPIAHWILSQLQKQSNTTKIPTNPVGQSLLCAIGVRATDSLSGAFLSLKGRQMISKKVAVKKVEVAVKNGELVRPTKCEVCGRETFKTNGIQPIVAHHWNGYDDPLNVWWICRSCNRFLLVHDGSLSIEQAKQIIRKKQTRRLFNYSVH